MLLPRNIKPALLEAAKDTPVILVNGARQTGKSTLIQGLFPSFSAPRYISFDNLATLDSARSDPQKFIETLPERVIIDEIQRVPELMLPIKHAVDQNRRPGRFFLTGSANVLALPNIADTLVGRMEIHTLWPLSQGELNGVRESFIDTAFSNKSFGLGKPIRLEKLVALMTAGGYPDFLQRKTAERQKKWFASYIATLIERDVRDLRQIEQLTVMPKLLKILAARAGGLLSYADLARSLTINLSTLKNYMSLLYLLFIVVPLPPWFGNIGKRLVKSPKIYLNDTGLLCHLLGRDEQALLEDGALLGMILENFVVMEIMKQLAWNKCAAQLYHFRTESGYEVDIVLEDASGRIVGIECKGAVRLRSDSFKGLKALKELTGKKFHRGIVLYMGSEILSFDKDFEAIPVSALWETISGRAPK